MPASDHYNSNRWAILLSGHDYSASLTLEGLTPGELVLTMQSRNDGYTDYRTALFRHCP